MECHVCLEAFDAAERRPKSLPCGHTYCQRCLLLLEHRRCPVDNQVFESAPADLADNYMVLQQSTKPATRFWCLTCEKVASGRCLDQHAVCSLKRARAEDAAPLLEALRHREDGLEKLGEQLQQEKEGLAAVRRRLEDAVEADTAAWTEAKQAAAQDGLSPSAVRLAAVLADPNTKCSLTVQTGAAGDVAWRGVVRTAGDAAATLLLSRLASRGGLQEQDQPDGEECPAAPRWQERRNEIGVREMAEKMTKGSKVARGRDWPKWWTADGTPPGPGTVDSVSGPYRYVIWDRTGKSHEYYMGTANRYDLRLLSPVLLKPYIATQCSQTQPSSIGESPGKVDDANGWTSDPGARLDRPYLQWGPHLDPEGAPASGAPPGGPGAGFPAAATPGIGPGDASPANPGGALLLRRPAAGGGVPQDDAAVAALRRVPAGRGAGPGARQRRDAGGAAAGGRL